MVAGSPKKKRKYEAEGSRNFVPNHGNKFTKRRKKRPEDKTNRE